VKQYVIATAIGLLMSGAAQAGTIGVTMANSDTFLTVLRNAIVSAAKEKNQSPTLRCR
jgi:ribose transport system substrate-binding protein/inositol transport system substrate-binding protein